MKSTALKYGGISGLILAVLFALSLAIFGGEEPNYELSEVIGYVTMILSMLVVFFGIKSYRDDTLGGVISFKTAFLTGLGIAAVGALIFVAFDTVYVTLINPDFFNDYMAWQIETMQADGASTEEIKKVRDQFEMFAGTTGLAISAVIMFLTVFLIGLVVSLISATILKKTA